MPQMSQVLRERVIYMLIAGISTRAVAREFNVHFSTISHLQRRFREFGSKSNRPHNHRPRLTHQPRTSISSIFTSKIVWDQPPGQLLQQSVCITKEFLHKLSETVLGKLICMLVILIGVPTVRCRNWLEWANPHIRWRLVLWRGVPFTDESRFLLYRADGRQRVWRRVGERFSDVNVVDRVAHGGSGVMVWAGVCYELRCILLIAFWIHRATVTRSWGPLLSHSSTTITSCCSMIMHSPMLQGSVHNSWKLKTSQFLHGQHTHRTCHQLSMFGMLWINRATSHIYWRGVDQHSTGHNQQPDQLYAKEMCCTAWGKWWSHQKLTGFQKNGGKNKNVAFII